MKIAFEPQIFFDQKYGGISRYFTKVALALNSIGEDVLIFGPKRKNAYLAEIPDSLIRWGVLSKIAGRFGHSQPRYNNFQVRKSINDWNPDVVHETYYEEKPFAKESIPRVTTVYDMIHELYPHMFPDNGRISKLKKMSVDRSDHVVCISHSTRNDLIEILGVNPQKVSVVHLGVDQITGSLSSSLVRKPRTERPYILFVGNRGIYKNFNLLVTAYASSQKLMRDFDLVAFGGGPFTVEEFSLFDHYKIQLERVHHRGGDDNKLAMQYIGASLFVYPSLYEGFGLPPLEAMRFGCPVASSNTSSMPEVLGDAVEYFDPLNEESIIKSLEAVLYNKQYTDDLIMKGFLKVQEYSWNRCAQVTLEIYHSLA
jgi:glycosyltransferase involved in cell wall biosynthesis